MVTGIGALFGGLTWFHVFSGQALYMTAVAFSAYGIHWFALGWNRYQGNSARPNVGMSVSFVVLSVLGAIVFFHAGDWPVGVLFLGLSAVYIVEVPASIGSSAGERALRLVHVLTGAWLMYLTIAVVLDRRPATASPSRPLRLNRPRSTDRRSCDCHGAGPART